ncbi:MAG: ribonuclease P protein component [Alphaproteobacteria bacterium]
MEAALGRLKRRPEFLSVAAAGRKWATPGMIVQQSRRRPDSAVSSESVRYGLTASKRVGNAVARNRARRRLRALAAELLPAQGQPGFDYVLIARAATLARGFPDLRRDLDQALTKLARRA